MFYFILSLYDAIPLKHNPESGWKGSSLCFGHLTNETEHKSTFLNETNISILIYLRSTSGTCVIILCVYEHPSSLITYSLQRHGEPGVYPMKQKRCNASPSQGRSLYTLKLTHYWQLFIEKQISKTQ